MLRGSMVFCGVERPQKPDTQSLRPMGKEIGLPGDELGFLWPR